MPRFLSRTACRSLRLVVLASAVITPLALKAAPLSWSLVYDQSVVSTSSQSLTRSLRGLALSDDGQTLYGGFIQKQSGAGVRQITLLGDPPVGTAGNFYNVTAAANGSSSADHQPKAVATDDRGFVFVGSSKDSTSGDNARVIIKDGNLSAAQKVFALADITATPSGNTGETIGGLSFRESGGIRYLYVSRTRPDSAYVERYVIGGTDINTATLTLDPTFGTGGQFSIRSVFGSASDLRGLEVAQDGTIFVTSHTDDTVYRVASDLASVTKQTVNNAIDLALFDSRVFVTSYDGAGSAIFELGQASTLDLLSSFDAFSSFGRDPVLGNINGTGYSGIDIDAQGRIYLADQFYFFDETVGGTDRKNDRILVSSALTLLSPGGSIPEPGSIVLTLLALAGLGLVRRAARS